MSKTKPNFMPNNLVQKNEYVNAWDLLSKVLSFIWFLIGNKNTNSKVLSDLRNDKNYLFSYDKIIYS